MQGLEIFPFLPNRKQQQQRGVCGAADALAVMDEPAQGDRDAVADWLWFLSCLGTRQRGSPAHHLHETVGTGTGGCFSLVGDQS